MTVVDNENIQVEKLELEIENTGHITNTYVIKDKTTNKICVIDPAFNEIKIQASINGIKNDLEAVIITHSHVDHIAALAKLVENTNTKVYVHILDYNGLYDKTLNEEDIVQTKVLPVDEEKVVKVKDKDIVKLGNTNLEVIHTPGHTKGSICLFDKMNNLLYSGDTIFEKTYGRTDLITGSREEMKNSLDSLFEKFEDIQILPGHGNVFNIKDSKRIIKLLFAYKG